MSGSTSPGSTKPHVPRRGRWKLEFLGSPALGLNTHHVRPPLGCSHLAAAAWWPRLRARKERSGDHDGDARLAWSRTRTRTNFQIGATRRCYPLGWRVVRIAASAIPMKRTLPPIGWRAAQRAITQQSGQMQIDQATIPDPVDPLAGGGSTSSLRAKRRSTRLLTHDVSRQLKGLNWASLPARAFSSTSAVSLRGARHTSGGIVLLPRGATLGSCRRLGILAAV